MMRILRQRSTLFSSNCDKRSKAHAAFSFAIDVPVFRALANGLIAPDEAISPLFSSQKLEIEGKNRASAGDWQNTSKGRIYTLTNLIANSSLNSHVELSVPEDKCMVLTEESEFMRKELETEVNKHHYNPNQLIDDSYRESDIDLEHASQTDSFLGPSFKNKEESSVDASYDPASKGNCQVEEATVSENVYHIGLFNDIPSEASEDGCKESEGDNMTVPELGFYQKSYPCPPGKAVKRKRIEEKPAEKKNVEEAPCDTGKGAEELQSGEILVSKTLSVQETVLVSGDAQGSNELTLELKPGSCEEFLVAKVSTDQAAIMNIVGSSASAVDLEMDRPREEASSYFIAALEAARETKSLASDHCEKLGSTIFPKGGYELAGKCGEAQTRIKS
uniref:Uncharacterized protein n=1 Tax=Salix viminalis TaxID=40686 RepID=A0A6N2MP47_SALVM